MRKILLALLLGVPFTGRAQTFSEYWDRAMKTQVASQEAELWSLALKAWTPADNHLRKAMVLINRAQAFEKLGRYDLALADCRLAIELDAKNPFYWFRSGYSNAKLGRYSDAIADLTYAIELDPSMASAYANRGLYRTKIRAEEEALADYTKALDLRPGDAVALANRGALYTKRREFEKAKADLDLAVKSDPTDASGWINRGLYNFETNNLTQAISDLTEGLRLAPDSEEALKNRSSVYINQRSYAAALADLSRLKEPNQPTLYLLATSKLHLGKPEAALEDINRYLARESDRRGLLKRAEIYRRLRKTKLEIADCDAAIAASTTTAASYVFRGMGRLLRGELAGAESDAKKALALDAKVKDGEALLGRIAFARGRLEDAKMHFSAALAHHDQMIWPNWGTALVAQQAGKTDEAKAAFAKVPLPWTADDFAQAENDGIYVTKKEAAIIKALAVPPAKN